MSTGVATPPPQARRVLVTLAVAQLLAMTPWFSASAVAPTLAGVWSLSARGAAWLTISVQLGFVAGALVSAILTLSDRWSARRLAAAAAALAALATLGIALVPGPRSGLVLRFITGAALAGVYPPGMKIAAGWFQARRGTALGILVGAITIGSAAPHLLRWAVPAHAWRLVVGAAGVLALLGACLTLVIPHDGPYAAPSPPFTWSAVPKILRDRAVMLANVGYLGHMWELYAMWTWLAVFVAESERARHGELADTAAVAAVTTFAAISSGALGSWLAGRLADAWGRTTVTSAAMVVSGACALSVGSLFGASLWALVPLLVLWGVAIVADSAQFSTAVSELAPRHYVGTALTLQTSLGFLLTTVTIYLVPFAAGMVGWRWCMTVLVLGPALGVWAMLRLRERPEAARLAGGRR